MKYCVDIREEKSGRTIKTILETESHDEAWRLVNEYNKEYGIYNVIGKEFPKSKYFIDVYNDESK